MTAIGGAGLMYRLGRSFSEAEASVQADEPLAPKTSIRVGGSAELFFKPRGLEGLVKLLGQAQKLGVCVQVLGGGANTLVGDLGVPGVTLKLPADLFPERVERSGDQGRVTLGAGASISRLLNLMRVHGLVGAEFLAGIPGTLGGAVTMNAGTKHGECMKVVEAIEVATADGVGWLSRAQLPFGYRHTELPAGGVVTQIRFVLPEGDLARSQADMDADLSYRKASQPLQLPSFGSVFRNPSGGFAGRLIETVGLKGFVQGAAQISTLHANWIVNLGGATARDITTLIGLAQQRVREQCGIELVPEVKKLGSFET